MEKRTESEHNDNVKMETNEACASCMSEIQILDLPDSLLLHIFQYLSYQGLLSISSSCAHFNAVAQDDLLWRGLFQRDFKVDKSVPLHPTATSWQREYHRLVDDSPAVLYQNIKSHKDQVLHVSFSHDGTMFATCSKDGKVMVWDVTKFPHERKFMADLTKELSWRYTQYSQFNKSDTLLLVSGVQSGITSAGEITVFDLQNFELQCRVENKPYDVFGCWYNDEHLFSGTLYWTGHFRSISALWLSKASQEVESERESVTKIIYRFANDAFSSVRTIMVADAPVVYIGNQPTAICQKCGLLRFDAGSLGGQEKSSENRRTSSSNEDFVKDSSNNCSSHQNIVQYRSLLDWIYGGSLTDWRKFDHQRTTVSGHAASLRSHYLSPQQSVSSSPLQRFSDLPAYSSHTVSETEEYSGDEGDLLTGIHTLEDTFIDLDTGLVNSAPPTSNFLSSLGCCCRKSDISEGALPSRSSEQEGDNVRVRKNFRREDISGAGRVSSSPSGAASLNSSANASPTVQNRAAPKELCENGTLLLHCPCIPLTHSIPRIHGPKLKTKKLLIFTMGDLTYTPHIIGFKWINLTDIRGQEETETELEDHLLPFVDENNHNQNSAPSTDPDILIDMEGHIVGMALSPDQRFLYVNCRQWPQNFVIDDPRLPPPIAQEIDIRVIDLLTFREVGTIMRSHKAFTPNDECFFLFLDASDLYVASGAEDKRGYLWDRHYGCHLRTFPHRDVVNCVAFSPQDEEMLVTVSDDFEISVWRSRRWMREEREKLEEMTLAQGDRGSKENNSNDQSQIFYECDSSQ